MLDPKVTFVISLIGVVDAVTHDAAPKSEYSSKSSPNPSTHVLETIRQVMAVYGQPDYIRSDDGSEFIAAKVQTWLKHNNIKTIYIYPDSPWQNGYIESFHSRLRDECLNRELLLNVPEAQVVLEDFRQHYNHQRPHSKLSYKSPEVFISENINPKLSHKVA